MFTMSVQIFIGRDGAKRIELILILDSCRSMWSNCANLDSPVSLGLFEGENKSKYFQKSLPQLCM